MPVADQGTYLRDLITINDTLIWSVDRTDSVIAAVRPSVATAFATASAAGSSSPGVILAPRQSTVPSALTTALAGSLTGVPRRDAPFRTRRPRSLPISGSGPRARGDVEP